MVSDTVAQYIASKKELKDSGSTLKITSAEMIMYATASEQTARRDSFDFLKTETIILTLFEYLNILKIYLKNSDLINSEVFYVFKRTGS